MSKIKNKPFLKKEEVKEIKKAEVLKVIEEIKQVNEPILSTVRQFLYTNGQYNENLIKTLERTYKDTKQEDNYWINIMITKKIIFK